MYDLALKFAERTEELLRRARCTVSLRNQLMRAAESIVLNIGEGAGHHSPGRKVYHYQTAHASAAECIAGLAILRRRNPHLDIQSLRRTADMICVMLMALIHKHHPPPAP